MSRVSAKFTEGCILETIRKEPGYNGTHYADVVGLEKTSIHIHLSNLQAEGLIEKRGDLSGARWFPVGGHQ